MTEKELEEYKRINNIEHVDVKGDEKVKQSVEKYSNFIMIIFMMIVQLAISMLSAVDGDIRNAFPKTTIEWVLWIALRVVTAVVTYMIFNAFVKEGEKRGKQTEQYKEANKKYMDLFCKNLNNEIKVPSPAVYLAKTRGIKALKLVIGAVSTGIVIADMTITANVTGLLGTIASLIMMAVWGYLKMLEVADYFVNEYPIYVAIQEHKLKQLEVNKDDHNRQSDVQESTRTSSEE